MANQILSDGFLADRAVQQRKPGTHTSDPANAGQAGERQSPSIADRADIGPARQRLSQESQRAGEPAIANADEARRQVALLREQLSGSPSSALKAHGGMHGDVFEAAMARPATQ